MTFCPDCEASRLSSGLWRMFNPACLWCGARLLQRIPTYSSTTPEASQRRKSALADWMRYGHSESSLRSLAKGPTPFAPITKEHKK